MRIEKTDEILLRLRKWPVIERMLRDALPVRQRTFAIACARLAGSLAELHCDDALLPLMKQTFAVAELMVEGVGAGDSRIVAGREAAGALAHDLDEWQLEMHGWILDDTEDGKYTSRSHPLNGTYAETRRRYAAADAAAFTLHKDPLAAAALCLEVVETAMRVDYDTLLAMARHWLIEPPGAIERDEVVPVFGRDAEE